MASKKKLQIVWLTSEATPFAKTGGLADVSASLPTALAKHGHDVTVIMPYYPRHMAGVNVKTHPLDTPLGVPFGFGEEWARIRELRVNDRTRFLFIEFDRFFDRPGLYDWMGDGYWDNPERFIFFSRAAMQTILALKLRPDILHAHDWHTALACVYLKSPLYRRHGNFDDTRSTLTIHNIGYQGVCGKNHMPLTGLGWEFFNYFCLEYYDQINLLKGGIMTADMVSTVSPSHAIEILSPEYGFTLDPSLQHRAATGKLRGILNGIDVEQWNPATDPALTANYSAKNLTGKATCKKALLKQVKLPNTPGTPLFGLVTRLAYQKGLDVFADAMDVLLSNGLDARFVLLGSGERGIQDHLIHLAQRHPDRFTAVIGYDEHLAHQIEAGSDMFVMPSRYEPCGLNQMYSMRYGTPPVARAIGGLNDTVVNFEDVNESEATGFKFWDLHRDAVVATIHWAVDVYKNSPRIFKRIQRNGMIRDFSWDHTAKLYEELYEDARR